MRIVSVNVGLPREIVWKGKPVLTGIFKSPTEGRIPMRTLNLDGDRQADLRVHGGPDKAVYAYPEEHYPFWRAALRLNALPPGAFGENLTLQGLTEDNVHVGDRFRMGTAEVVVTQPRIPCFKLAAKFGRTPIIKEFLQSGRSGFYLAVLQEGDVESGDTVEVISRDAGRVRIADLNRIFRGETVDIDLIQRASQVEALATSWRGMLEDWLQQSASPGH